MSVILKTKTETMIDNLGITDISELREFLKFTNEKRKSERDVKLKGYYGEVYEAIIRKIVQIKEGEINS